jgi:hypothetical protein
METETPDRLTNLVGRFLVHHPSHDNLAKRVGWLGARRQAWTAMDWLFGKGARAPKPKGGLNVQRDGGSARFLPNGWRLVYILGTTYRLRSRHLTHFSNPAAMRTFDPCCRPLSRQERPRTGRA